MIWWYNKNKRKQGELVCPSLYDYYDDLSPWLVLKVWYIDTGLFKCFLCQVVQISSSNKTHRVHCIWYANINQERNLYATWKHIKIFPLRDCKQTIYCLKKNMCVVPSVHFLSYVEKCLGTKKFDVLSITLISWIIVDWIGFLHIHPKFCETQKSIEKKQYNSYVKTQWKLEKQTFSK